MKILQLGPLLVVILLSGINCHAQEIQLITQAYTIDDGLSQNMVKAIYEDREGFMWFGTKDGLNRFDGHQFVVYRNEAGNTLSLSNNNINSIFEDRAGNLWIGTAAGGLNFFDRRKMSFCMLPEVLVKGNIPEAKQILKIREDVNGDIWALNPHFVFRIRILDKKAGLHIGRKGLQGQYTVDTFFGDHGIEGNRLRCSDLRPATDGRIYFASNNGVFVSRKSIKEEYNPVFVRIREQGASNILEDGFAKIWLGSAHSLSCYDPKTGKEISYQDRNLKNPIYSDLTLGPDGKIWMLIWEQYFGTNQMNIYISSFDPISGTFRHEMQHADKSPCFLYFARRNILWIGTAGFGVLKYNEKSIQFHYQPEQMLQVIERNRLELANIFYQNSAFVLVRKKGSPKLTLFNWISEKFYPLSDARKLLQPDRLPGFRANLSFTHPAFVRRNGEIWVCAPNFRDICLLNDQGEIIKTLSIGDIDFLFCENAEEDFFIGYDTGGFYKMINKDEGVEHLRTSNISFYHSNVLSYLAEEDGSLWIGTVFGLMRMQYKNGGYTVDKIPKAEYSILSLLNDALHPDDVLWIGTEGGGLLELDKKTRRVKQYLKKEGLPNEVVYGIMADSRRNLWMSTNNGLSKFNLISHVFTNFRKSDGLQSNEFNRFSYGKFPDGTMYFGGIKGINWFKPEDLKQDTVPPQLSFTDLKLFNHYLDFRKKGRFLTQPVEYTRSLTLPWNQNMLSFYFTAFDFSAPDMITYAWKLEGADKSWDTSMSSRSATYANLSPGNYRFMLKASNSEGYWTKEPVQLELTILPPWWQSWWAYTLYALVLTGMTIGIFRFRLNRLRLHDALKMEKIEAQRLQLVDEMKSRFFTNITHELRTPLTLILGPTEQLLKTIQSKEEVLQLNLIYRNARKLLRLINQLLDLNKLESDNMMLEEYSADVVQLVAETVEAFVPNAQSRGIELVFRTGPASYHITSDLEKLQKILDNLLSNALKFTLPGGAIEVFLDKNEKDGMSLLCISVKDSGIGISVEQQARVFDRFYQADSSHTRKGEGTGIGLALVKELVELLNGKLTLESEIGKGSTFRVELPVKPLQDAAGSVAALMQNKNRLLDTHLPELAQANLQQEPEDDDKPLALIIEDNQDMRAYIRSCLQNAWQVIEAGNGANGINIAYNQIPDIVISDIMMPEKDGYEVTEALKNDERTSHIPIILLTAKTTVESRLKGFRTKADAYLIKPFNTEELLVNAENLISIRKKLSERYKGNLQQLAGEARKNREDKFMLKLRAIIEHHIGEEEFGVEQLCEEAHLSRTQLHRKIKALSGHNTSYYIRQIRLEYALSLLKEEELSISEIAYKAGFNTPNYFSSCFHEYFGFMPSELLKKGSV